MMIATTNSNVEKTANKDKKTDSQVEKKTKKRKKGKYNIIITIENERLAV